MLGDEPRQPATPRRILVVEDNELNLKLLADLLEYQGYGVTVTSVPYGRYGYAAAAAEYGSSTQPSDCG